MSRGARRILSGVCSSVGALVVGVVMVASASPAMAGRTAASHPADVKAIAVASLHSATQMSAKSTFCSLAASASKNNTSAAASASVASLQADYAKLKSEEPQVLAIAPPALKGDFQTLFTFFNGFYSELASVKYNFLKMPLTYLKSLENSATNTKLVAATKAIAAYLKKDCGIKSA